MVAILEKYAAAFSSGLVVTLQLSAIVWIVGLLLGGAIGLALGFSRPGVRHAGRYLFFAIGSVPAIVALFWFHYPIQYYLGVSIYPFYTAAAVISAYNVVTVAGMTSIAVRDFPRQYLDAATTNGIHGWLALRKVMFPMLLRQMLPALLISQINALHMTLFASLISVDELFRVAQRVNSIEYKPIEIFSALGLFYLIASFPLMIVADYCERRYQNDYSEK